MTARPAHRRRLAGRRPRGRRQTGRRCGRRTRASPPRRRPDYLHVVPEPHWRRGWPRSTHARRRWTPPRAAPERLPLLGVPFAVKDNIDIAGEPTTRRLPRLRATSPSARATAVRRLLDAGALWLGKTNLDQFATGLVGTRSPYGAARQHLRRRRASAAARAPARRWRWRAASCAFALGTDTAGSGRVPAGFNGIVGLKPTPGRVSTAGVVPACRIARLRLGLRADGGRRRARCWRCSRAPTRPTPTARFEPGAGARCRRGCASACRSRRPTSATRGYEPRLRRGAARSARALGHDAGGDRLRAAVEVAALLYDGPWVAERHAVLRRLLRRATRGDRPGGAPRHRARRAYSAADAFAAQYRLRAARRRAPLWHASTCCWCPPRPTTRRSTRWRPTRSASTRGSGIYTNFVNLLGWCALALPAGARAAACRSA